MVRTAFLAAVATALVAAPGLTLPAGGPTASAGATVGLPLSDPRPSIVLVVADDFSMDLLATMRNAREMRRTGAFYRHSFVVDSRCCPSRVSLFTGQYPHQTGVYVNERATLSDLGPIGGFEAFAAHGNAERSVNVRLQQSGYTTGYVGKYLNGYSGQWLPPGWSWWRAIVGSAYEGWGFRTTRLSGESLTRREHPAPPPSASEARKDRAYAGRVATRMALRFIDSHRGDPAPYFLQVSPYAVHSRINPGTYQGDPLFPPAFRDRGWRSCGARACTDLDARDLPGFGDRQGDNAPRYADGEPAADWRRGSRGPTARQLTRDLQNRARMAQSIDRLLGRILDAVGPDTYVIFTSDNGFHLGQHRLGRGKGTPFTSDVRVPLLVVGPGVRRGTRTEVVSNLDLAPTFEALAGLGRAPYRSGWSLVPTLRHPTIERRGTTFFEHLSVPSSETGASTDPDVPFDTSIRRIPSYVAVRTRTALLARFDLDPTHSGVDHAWEFYDYRRRDWEQTNEYGRERHAERIQRLTDRLEQFEACSTVVRDDPVPAECRALTQ